MSVFNVFRSIQKKVRWYFKQRMLPMTVDEAEDKREFLAKIYFISSFSAFSYIIYCMHQHKVKTYDPSVSSAETAVEYFKIDGKVRIMKFDGLTKVKDYIYERKNIENEETQNQNLDSELVVDKNISGKSEVIDY